MNSVSGLIANDAFLVGLYGGLPKFNSVNLHQINLNWNGPCVKMVFDLSEFPIEPPKKWTNFNKIQIDILLYPLLEIDIQKFSNGNFCDVHIEKIGAVFHIDIRGESKARFVASSVSINNISAYLDGPCLLGA